MAERWMMPSCILSLELAKSEHKLSGCEDSARCAGKKPQTNEGRYDQLSKNKTLQESISDDSPTCIPKCCNLRNRDQREQPAKEKQRFVKAGKIELWVFELWGDRAMIPIGVPPARLIHGAYNADCDRFIVVNVGATN